MIGYTYLMIDLLTLLVPLVFSFHPRIQLYKRWDSLLPSILIVACCYVIWDIYFTKLGLWGFNPKYLTGIRAGNLPLEEILFFFCIPYACVFTFECVAPAIKSVFRRSSIKIVNYVFVITLTTLAVIFREKPYTLSAFVVLALMIVMAELLKAEWLGKFYLVYAILLVPFFVVNGILTGTGLSSPVVWYSPAAITGFRILTVPVEDIFYGMGLILANVWLYIAFRTYKGSNKYISV